MTLHSFVLRCVPLLCCAALSHAEVLVQGAGLSITSQDVVADSLKVPEEARKAALAKADTVSQVAVSLFARRAFNIHSLAVGETEDPNLSRITVVVDGAELPLEQVTKQLNKLVEVLKVVELEPSSSVQRQVMLIKVKADAATRSQVLEMVQMFRAKVVDVATESLTIEATGNSEKLRALLEVLEPYGIKELVQSGMVAIGRGPRSITDRALTKVS